MDIKVGSVVVSRAGHDKDDFFVVLKVSGKNVIICDGKRRTLEKPKVKNEKHLIVTKEKLDASFMQTNCAIRKKLNLFKKMAEG